MTTYIRLHTADPSNVNGPDGYERIDDFTWQSPPSSNITHAVIYDSAFKPKRWHRLAPRRWRPTGLIASLDLGSDA